MRSVTTVAGVLALAAMGGAASTTYALPPGNPAVARTLYDAAVRLGAGDKVKLALFEAAVVESKMQNLSWGDRDSRGVLQIRTSLWGWATATQPALSAEWFLRRAIPPADYVMYRLRLGTGLNVHNLPNWGSRIAGVLKAGTIVDVYGFVGGGSTGLTMSWLKIWYSNSWQYIANIGTAKVGLSVQVTRDVRVETGTGLAGWLPQNAIIHCWAWSNHWYRVWWNGNWRWIHSLYTRQA